jgi:two-component system KDP operon response regulator KdpE
MKMENNNCRVLVIDDEKQIRRLLATSLEMNGYRVFKAANGETGIASAIEHKPDMILLDLCLPDMDGVEVLKRLREWCLTPVIILSVRDLEEEKIRVLDCGADDYMTKPFGTSELLARLRATQRRVRSSVPVPHAAPFASGPLEVDLESRTVKVDRIPVKLSPIEFSLLVLFIRHVGKVLTHRQIMEEVWGSEYVNRTNYLHVYIALLRQKIEANPANPELLVSEPRVGYRLLQKSFEVEAPAPARIAA